MEKTVLDLATMGDQVIPVCLTRLKDSDEYMLGVLSLIIETLGDESVIDPLLRLLFKPGLPDLNKTCILNILCYFGYDPSELPLEDMFNDFQGIAEASMEKLLEDISRDNNLLPIILEEFGGFPTDFQITLINELVSKGDKRAIELLSLFARTGDTKIAVAAIKGLGQLAIPEAATALEFLVRHGDEALRVLAARELMRLRMKRVTPERKKIVSKKRDTYKVIISSIDGRGNRVIWFTWRIPRKKPLLLSVNLLLNTETGIKECWGNNRLTLKEFKIHYEKLKEKCTLLETSSA